jgi:hypothetical protein
MINGVFDAIVETTAAAAAELEAWTSSATSSP